MTDPARPLLTEEAADFLRITPRTLYALVAKGEIARTGTHGKHLFLMADLNDWLHRQRVPSKAERDANEIARRRRALSPVRPDPARVAELFGEASR